MQDFQNADFLVGIKAPIAPDIMLRFLSTPTRKRMSSSEQDEKPRLNKRSGFCAMTSGCFRTIQSKQRAMAQRRRRQVQLSIHRPDPTLSPVVIQVTRAER